MTEESRQAVSGLSAAQIMAVAEQAEAAGDTKSAMNAYAALANDPDVDTRNEARFRHGRLLAGAKDYKGAALLYRKILDERPQAGRVRLELASTLYRMGDAGSAFRAMRQAQAGGLPADVALMVDQFAGALRSMKPWGVSFSAGLAPDSNINRSTSARTLDTVIAPLDLSEDAQRQSGVGLKVGAQAYLRVPLAQGVTLLPRLSSEGELYRKSQFNDVSASLQLGMQMRIGSARVQPALGATWRRYGTKLYARTQTASINWLQGVGSRSQVDTTVSASRAHYVQNALQDGWLYNLSTAYEQAFDARSGGSLTMSLNRHSAKDPGYSTLAGGPSVLYWRELGGMTLFGAVGVSRLEADAKLFLFPERRKEWLYHANFGGTFRRLAIGGFAPVAKLTLERNHSTVGIYDYRRTALEFGVTRAF